MNVKQYTAIKHPLKHIKAIPKAVKTLKHECLDFSFTWPIRFR